jgi:hypothetical protein
MTEENSASDAPLPAVLDSIAPGVFCFDASFFKKTSLRGE